MIAKRILALVLALSALSFAQQSSLGDVARQTRTHRKPGAKVITNEDLPSAPVPATQAASSSSDKEAGESKEKESQDGAEALKEREKDFLARFAKEKQALDLLNRELNVLQRENQLQIAAFYADAGTRLRDPQAFAEKSKRFTEDIAAKQKAVEEIKQKVEALKEEARHAGLPSRLFE
jgi:hypothetical protein